MVRVEPRRLSRHFKCRPSKPSGFHAVLDVEAGLSVEAGLNCQHRCAGDLRHYRRNPQSQGEFCNLAKATLPLIKDY